MRSMEKARLNEPRDLVGMASALPGHVLWAVEIGIMRTWAQFKSWNTAKLGYDASNPLLAVAEEHLAFITTVDGGLSSWQTLCVLIDGRDRVLYNMRM